MLHQLPSESVRIITKKRELNVSRTITAPLSSPAQGESILALERFALTTNNITYAAFGQSMRYWDFFPTGQPEWGHMPVWGIASVIESTVADVEPGHRYFGFYPIAEHFICKPNKVSERGFADATDHRQPLPAAYNYYSLCNSEHTARGEKENYEILIRPLFLTSYMLADYLQDNRYFGAEQMIVSSASSKTAYGSAYCMSEMPIPLIGLTSPRNMDFVKRTNCYTDVVLYDDLETIDNGRQTLYVDFQGAEALRYRVHRHFSERLKHDCFVGSAANIEPPQSGTPSSAETKFFFAAQHINKLNREVGPVRVDQQLGRAQDRFVERISSGDDPWLRIVENVGIQSAENVVRLLYENRIEADEGHIIVLP